jgi:hypothetical protein
LAQCLRDRGTLPHVIAPAGERVFEVDPPVVDLGQWDQQIGDREVGGVKHQQQG